MGRGTLDRVSNFGVPLPGSTRTTMFVPGHQPAHSPIHSIDCWSVCCCVLRFFCQSASSSAFMHSVTKGKMHLRVGPPMGLQLFNGHHRGVHNGSKGARHDRTPGGDVFGASLACPRAPTASSTGSRWEDPSASGCTASCPFIGSRASRTEIGGKV